jgi:hypothetical protein
LTGLPTPAHAWAAHLGDAGRGFVGLALILQRVDGLHQEFFNFSIALSSPIVHDV